MGEDIVQSPKAISMTMEDLFDTTFSQIVGGGVAGPDLSESIFRVANDDEAFDKSSGCSAGEPSPEGSWGDHDSIEDVLDAERNKDAQRKYHALKELLTTELGYLADLKALVSVRLVVYILTRISYSNFARFIFAICQPWL